MNTLRIATIAIATLTAGAATAQTATQAPATMRPGTTMTLTTEPTAGTGGGSTTGHPTNATPETNAAGRAAAGGDANEAVATTRANAPQPAHGSNSFSDGEARRRIEASGYTDVTGLRKDAEGVWRGTGKKNGATANVWLDYKGNVGAS